jgi:ferredoxin
MAAGGWAAAQLYGVTSRMHPTVRLAEQVIMEDTGETRETTLESRTFRSTGMPQSELFKKAISIRNQFYYGGWILGGLLGLVFVLKLIGLSVRRTRIDYEPDPGSCLSCGRCFNYCPKEHLKLEEERSST